MKTKLLLLLCLLSFALPCGAQIKYYTLNKFNIPLLTSRYDADLSWAVSADGRKNGNEFQFSFSPFKRTGVFFNTVRSARLHPELKYDQVSQNLKEGGVGLFLPVNNHVLASISTGYGRGTVQANYSSVSQKLDAHARLRFEKWFFQPALKVHTNAFLFNYGLQIMGLNFYKGDVTGVLDYTQQNALSYLNNADQNIFLTQDIGAGFYIRPFMLQLDLTSFLGSPEAIDQMQLSKHSIHVSLLFELHALWKRKQVAPKTGTEK